MATAKRGKAAGRTGLTKWLALLLVAGGAAWWLLAGQFGGYARAATSYGARTACACQFLAGREAGSCKTASMPGQSLVFLSADEGEKSVTAYVPLVASTTANYHEGFGCVLEPWQG